jgi:uncharacterized protein (DUF58 family)
VDLGVEALVYPRPAGELALPVPTAGNAPHAGRVAGQDDFSGFRAYARGDPPRRVHWKAVAREQPPVVKLFAGGAGGELVLRWEQAGGDAVEARLSQLCRWVLEAQRNGLRYGLELPGVGLAPAQGEDHLRRCLAALACHGESRAG